jgi:hypothetical protein
MEERKLKVITEEEIKAVEEDVKKLDSSGGLTNLINSFEVVVTLDEAPVARAAAFEYSLHLDKETKAKSFSGKLTLLATSDLGSLLGKRGHLKASCPVEPDKENQVFFNSIVEFDGYKHYMNADSPASYEEFSFHSIF